MSENELYELAQHRINKRNRQWLFLGADILAFFIFVAAFVTFYSIIPHNVGVFIAVVWVGVLAFHAMAANAMQNRNAEIESEVERLRRAIYDEKPKRVELNDDGELNEFTETPQRKTKYN